MTSTTARAVVVLGLCTLITRGAFADDFTDRHASGVAVNTYGAFSIRVKAGRSIFHIGERIELELVYDRPGYEVRQFAAGGAPCVLVEFDRAVSRQLTVYEYEFANIVLGGVRGCVTYTPAVTHLTLTDAYRFDVPGRYRLFVKSRQITSEFETSNVVEFQILPRDPAWEAETLERAKTTRAFADLRALGTAESVRVLAGFYQTDDSDAADATDIWNGLASYPDRRFVVDTLLAELTRPERRMTRRFMPGLANLELARRHAAGPPPIHDEYRALMRKFAIRRATALNTIPGRLEHEIREELSWASDNEQYFVRGGVTTAARAFAKETTAAFLSLTAEAQRSRLVGMWRVFADPVFLPMVRSLYQSPAEDSDRVRDVALRRLYELAPREARRAMLAELQRRRPRVSIETLGTLPDVALPRLENQWVQQLQNAAAEEDRLSAAQRLERFGTAKVSSAVRKFYGRVPQMACATRASLLAYLVRTGGVRAEPLLRTAAVGDMWDETCEGALIEAVAELEWTPGVERSAFVALAFPDVDLTIDVARLLAERGSRSARRPLERRLAEVQASIAAARRSSSPSVEEGKSGLELEIAEDELARALDGAKSWRLTDAEREQFRGRCSDDCGGAFVLEPITEPQHTIRVYGPARDHELSASVDHYAARSLRDISFKLRQFPRGTRFYYNDRTPFPDVRLEQWTLSERNALFERLKNEAAAYGVILQGERKPTVTGSSLCPQ